VCHPRNFGTIKKSNCLIDGWRLFLPLTTSKNAVVSVLLIGDVRVRLLEREKGTGSLPSDRSVSRLQISEVARFARLMLNPDKSSSPTRAQVPVSAILPWHTDCTPQRTRFLNSMAATPAQATTLCQPSLVQRSIALDPSIQLIILHHARRSSAQKPRQATLRNDPEITEAPTAQGDRDTTFIGIRLDRWDTKRPTDYRQLHESVLGTDRTAEWRVSTMNNPVSLISSSNTGFATRPKDPSARKPGDIVNTAAQRYPRCWRNRSSAFEVSTAPAASAGGVTTSMTPSIRNASMASTGWNVTTHDLARDHSLSRYRTTTALTGLCDDLAPFWAIHSLATRLNQCEPLTIKVSILKLNTSTPRENHHVAAAIIDSNALTSLSKLRRLAPTASLDRSAMLPDSCNVCDKVLLPQALEKQPATSYRLQSDAMLEETSSVRMR
jgi:hypothetical protein